MEANAVPTILQSHRTRTVVLILQQLVACLEIFAGEIEKIDNEKSFLRAVWKKRTLLLRDISKQSPTEQPMLQPSQLGNLLRS